METLFDECDEASVVGSANSRGFVEDHVPKLVHEPSQADEKEDTNISATALRKILERQKYRCAITGEPLTPQECSLDHVLALTNGGRHELGNIQFILPAINRMKGVKYQDEFVRLCRMVAEYNH